jgi:hypothetical protein
VEVEDDVEACVLEPGDPGADRPPVDLAAELGVDPIDAEPAGLVERHPDRIDVPRLHRLDRVGVTRPIEEPVPLLTRVLGPRAVDPEQADRLAGAVDQVRAADTDPRLRGRGGGEDQEGEGDEER